MNTILFFFILVIVLIYILHRSSKVITLITYENPICGYENKLKPTFAADAISENNDQLIAALNSDINYVISPIDLKDPEWLKYAINYVPEIKIKLRKIIYRMSNDPEYKSRVMNVPAIYDGYDKTNIYPNMYAWIADTLVMAIGHLAYEKGDKINDKIDEINKTFIKMLNKLE